MKDMDMTGLASAPARLMVAKFASLHYFILCCIYTGIYGGGSGEQCYIRTGPVTHHLYDGSGGVHRPHTASPGGPTVYPR